MSVSSSAQIRLRYAKPSDARALVALQAEIYREGRWFVGDGPTSTESLTRRLRTLDAEMSLYLVALGNVQGGNPLRGERPRSDYEPLCGWLELHRPPPARLQHTAMLTIAVSQHWRQQGVGTKLMQQAYRWSQRVGVEKIQLNVRANNSAAIALYETEGFVREGLEHRQILDRGHYEDNVLMAKFL
ncbi:MAG: GNAT family N-acetyltransferase [Trueperaceae bacterium]|nr:GNAT family N-acetyltransferase [Trueperaceae bacterium]